MEKLKNTMVCIFIHWNGIDLSMNIKKRRDIWDLIDKFNKIGT